MTGPQKANLRRRRKDVRALAIKKTSLTKKRRILQKGGFLTAPLPPVLSILSSMFLKKMQSARKLIVVDESDREYKLLQRPSNAVAKTKHSLEVSNTLRDSTLADNQKVRE